MSSFFSLSLDWVCDTSKQRDPQDLEEIETSRSTLNPFGI